MPVRSPVQPCPAFAGLTLADLVGIMLTFEGTRLDTAPLRDAVQEEIVARIMDINARWKAWKDARPLLPPPPPEEY